MLGLKPTATEFDSLFAMKSENGKVDVESFLHIVEKQLQTIKRAHNEFDENIEEAFVALGGNSDHTGTVSCNKLVHVVDAFGLNMDAKVKKYRHF